MHRMRILIDVTLSVKSSTNEIPYDTICQKS